MKTAASIAIAVAFAGLVGCSESKPAETPVAEAPAVETPAPEVTPASAPTPQQIIETRQANLKDLGKNFKAIADQTKAATLDMAVIAPAADTVKTHASEIGNWFPAGTGPESGVKTEALPKIWEDRATFDAAVTRLQAEAAKLQTAAASGDAAAVKAQFPETGKACKNCHDTFRMKEEK
jgi:cytochrome c556